MKMRLLCVGKVKEKYLRDGIAEYTKRLGAYGQIEIVEVPDEKTPDRASEAENEKIKSIESQRILGKIRSDDFVILLDLQGKSQSSEQMASLLSKWMVEGKSQFVFVIGGSLGVSEELRRRAQFLLSFSAMTFPHQLMRLIFLEQLYRWHKIINHEPYHK